MAVEFERECFFIAPIGDKGSDIRRRSDGVRDWIVRPAAEAHGLQTLRADDVGKPGQITSQAVQHCLKAKAAVADLTGGNPNVYYELSVRHGAQLPVVLIAEADTKLPFDVGQSRVIFFDHKDLSDAGRARGELQEQIEESLDGVPDNPIANGMRLAELQGGGGEERVLALVMERLEGLGATTADIDARLRKAERADAAEVALGNRILHSDSRHEDWKWSYLNDYARSLREAWITENPVPEGSASDPSGGDGGSERQGKEQGDLGGPEADTGG